MKKNYFIHFSNGETKKCFVDCVEKEPGIFTFEITDNIEYELVDYIEVPIMDEELKAGEEGFFLLQSRDTGIGYFTEREDTAEGFWPAKMAFYGVKHGEKCVVPIVTGMYTDLLQSFQVKDNVYILNMRFDISNKAPYENIKIEFHVFNNADATYVDFAKIYRNHQLKNGFKTLKERDTEVLSYMKDSANIRIRMGWKPVPVEITEQTLETEPPMHVACTFRDVIQLMEEYHKIGIKKAEFCLVGWNVRGHDGRWPQIFPVEESLGGEAELKNLISRAKELGYLVTCHTSSTDAYSIANNFRLGDIIENRDRSLSVQAVHWAGGRTYNICSEKAYEMAMTDLPQVAELGFRGMHYIDVVTAVPARECNHPIHPVNKREWTEYYNKIFAKCKELFGAIGSEGSFDHAMRECDSVLYASFSDYADKAQFEQTLLSESIPLWQLVYHGIVFSNPYAKTINVMAIEEKEDLLKCIEYGGRPQLYYYASFVNKANGNWIGRGDLHCHTQEEIEESAKIAKTTEEVFSPLSYLQYELMEDHKKLSDGVYETTYADGSVVLVDYCKKTYTLKKGTE